MRLKDDLMGISTKVSIETNEWSVLNWIRLEIYDIRGKLKKVLFLNDENEIVPRDKISSIKSDFYSKYQDLFSA